MSIIISQKGKDAVKVERGEFEKENFLQEYILANPESIPVYEIDVDKRLFVAAREFGTESGPIDALAVDKDGDIYIVETKLFKNPDKRTVVAQALDYGAAVWKHSGDFSQFIGRLDAKVRSTFNVRFEEKLKDFFGLTDEEAALVLEAMRRNLFEGNLKFVILMDAIDERLKDLIIYVNQNSQFDIYAVQLEYYKHAEYEIVIPRLFGAEVKKNVSTGISQTKFDDIRSEFWQQFLKEDNQGPRIFTGTQPTTTFWISTPLNLRHVTLGIDVLKNYARVTIAINPPREDGKRIFDYLYQKKQQIETDFGGELMWERKNNNMRSNISFQLESIDCYDQANWPKINAFLIDSAMRMKQAFEPRLRELKK